MMRKHIIFKISLMLMLLAFGAEGADFGMFKSEWTKYPVNQKKTVVTETMFVPDGKTPKKPVKPTKSSGAGKYADMIDRMAEEQYKEESLPQSILAQ